MTIELIPPTSPLHRKLWAMGFGKEQRARIIRIGIVLFRNPVDVGRLICRMNHIPVTKVKEIMAEMAKTLDR